MKRAHFSQLIAKALRIMILMAVIVVGMGRPPAIYPANTATTIADNVSTNLSSVVATQVALLTSPGHDPRRTPNVLASWAGALDRALGEYWLAATAHDSMAH